MVLGGLPLCYKAFFALKNKTIDMHVLMSMAVIGATVAGEWIDGALVVLLFGTAQILEQFVLLKVKPNLWFFVPPYKGVLLARAYMQHTHTHLTKKHKSKKNTLKSTYIIYIPYRCSVRCRKR